MPTIFQAGLPLSKTIVSKTKQSLKQIKQNKHQGLAVLPLVSGELVLNSLRDTSPHVAVFTKSTLVFFLKKTKQKQKQKQTKTPTSLLDQQGQMMQICIFCRINPTSYILNILKVISGFSKVSFNFGLLATALYFK